MISFKNTTTEVAVIEKKSDVELNELLKDIPVEELNQFCRGDG
jgi:hypothetical protein